LNRPDLAQEDVWFINERLQQMTEEETPAQAEDALERAMAMREYAAARRGLYLTVHALKKAEEVLKWELAAERDKAVAS
jgi:hypothetical protein